MEAAWVCVYGALTPSGDGAALGWTRQRPPVRVSPGQLRSYQRDLDQLVPADPERACRADLGPRYLLVYAHDAGLAGVTVDAYGCEEVRLTDNPAETAPGEAGGSGSVPGVLQSPTGLLKALKATANASGA